ncbi:MAG: hypothetical protein ACLFV7_09610 [Phycisphaerae bacterium]
MADWKALLDDAIIAGGDIGPEQLQSIPARRGVALLATADDRPILLLPAADMRARVRNRLRDPESDEVGARIADLLSITRRVYWTQSTSHFQTDLDYFELARTLWPKSFAELVSTKAPVFVSVDLQEDYPAFRRTRDVVGHPGQLVGPFPTGKDADRFIQGLEDTFDLCRDLRHLSQAPHGQRCPYAQMGRCLCPCDGSVSAEEYSSVVQRAARFAAGERHQRRDELQAAMKAASAALEFEKAAAIKKRLQRLDEFDSPAYQHVAPIEQFEMLILQPTGRINEARAFLFRAGRIPAVAAVAFPPDLPQLTDLLAAMESIHPAAMPPEPPRVTAIRMGVVSKYLYSAPERRGVMIRRREGMSAEELAEILQQHAELLALRRRALRGGGEQSGESANPAGSSGVREGEGNDGASSGRIPDGAQ